MGLLLTLELPGWGLSFPGSCVAVFLLCHPNQVPLTLWGPPMVPLELL